MSKNLIIEIEALHDEITGNYVLYTEQAISDFESWISPYKKPAILHHKDEDGKIVGRVLEAKKIPSKIRPGLSALWLKARITDQETIQGIKNGTYLTTSVGAKGTHVECSICGHRIDSGYACQHKKGKKYKSQLCYWIVKGMTAKEISFVIVPSDKYSQIVKFYDEEGSPTEHEEPKPKEGEKEMELQEALQKIQELEAANATLTAQLETANTSLQESEQKLAEEVVLRQGLESEIQNIHLAEKQASIDSILALREKLGLRVVERSAFESKDQSYLQEALTDLEAELAFKESQQHEEDPNEDPNEEDVKKLRESEVTNQDVPLEKKTSVNTKKSPKSIVSDLLG